MRQPISDDERSRSKRAVYRMSALVRPFIVVLVIACCSAPRAFAADELRKDYSDDELVSMLLDGGFRSVERVEPGTLSLRIDGLEYYLFVYDDGDLQLWFGLTGYDVNLADMNQWNRDRRLVRAYLDDEDDPILESDLLANAGYTDRHLTEWISVFDSFARLFRDFVAERSEANANGARRKTRQPD